MKIFTIPGIILTIIILINLHTKNLPEELTLTAEVFAMMFLIAGYDLACYQHDGWKDYYSFNKNILIFLIVEELALFIGIVVFKDLFNDFAFTTVAFVMIPLLTGMTLRMFYKQVKYDNQIKSENDSALFH